MIRLGDTCPCTSTFSLDAEYSYEIGSAHEEWIKRHEPCRKAWLAKQRALTRSLDAPASSSRKQTYELSQSGPSTVVSVRFEPETLERLEKLANATGYHRSTLIRRGVMMCLEYWNKRIAEGGLLGTPTDPLNLEDVQWSTAGADTVEMKLLETDDEIATTPLDAFDEMTADG